MCEFVALVEAIEERRRQVPAELALLVALSGIDASGKGYVAERAASALRRRGFRVAGIGVDGWLALPDRRFARAKPGEHFYEHAIRFDELFANLVLPLKATRGVRLVADFTEETATRYRKHTYAYEEVDVILLEGVLLLKRAYRGLYDLSAWVDCSFETALERALARGQEGLSPAQTVRAYETIYFPAQRLHFERDRPREAADLVLANDPRLFGVQAGCVAPR